MKVDILKNILLMIVLSSFVLPAYAENELTPERVEQWILSQNALEQWGQQHHETIAAYEDQPESMQDLGQISASTILQPLKSSGLYDSAEAVIRKYGFASLTEWAETTIVITRTAAVIELENRPEVFDIAQLEALTNDPKLSSEEKKLLKQTIDRNLTTIKQLYDSVTAHNREVVRPFLERINKLAEQP